MPSEEERSRAVEMLKNTEKSKAEIAEELGISKQSVAAYAAHITMGRYDGEAATEEFRPSVSRERDIENYLAQHPGAIEDGLELRDDGQQVPTDVGRIDLLGRDTEGNEVVIEVKKGEASDSALGQLLGYMEQRRNTVEGVRGIIVAETFSDRIKKAASRFDDVGLVAFEVEYHFNLVRC